MARKRAGGAGGAPETVFGDDDRREIANTMRPPYSSICLLETHWPDKTLLYGTGFIFGSSTVFTCGHLLYNPVHGGMAAKVVVAPGVTCGSTPFGTVTVDTRSLRVFPEYLKERVRDDLGAILLPTPLGKRTGWSNVAPRPDVPLCERIVVTGFTAQNPKIFSSFKMLQSKGQLLKRQDDYGEHDADASAGQSGGPIWSEFETSISGYIWGFHKAEWSGGGANILVLLTWRHYDWIQARTREAEGLPFASFDDKAARAGLETEPRPRRVTPNFNHGEGPPAAASGSIELQQGEQPEAELVVKARRSSPAARRPATAAADTAHFTVPAKRSHTIALDLRAGQTVKGTVKVALPSGTFTDFDIVFASPDDPALDHLPMFVSSSGATDFQSDRFSFAAQMDGRHSLVFKELNGVSAAIVQLKLKIG
ncbi:MAG TPA: trypsin-like peptidase domain-containing protein [Allosphingosinicella sp.]|nr:trypsin-like peptidase domain-containing protein [Allosphingosinicella sp.]